MLQFEGQELQSQIQLKDVSQKKVKYLRDVSEEASLINLPGEVSEICKSALFEMSRRCCTRRLKDASEMHPYWLGNQFVSCGLYVQRRIQGTVEHLR